MRRLYLSNPDDKNQADKLANQVLNTTISALITYGNVLTDAHKEALSILAKALAYSLYAKSGKRTLIPLFTGGGKTQTVISHAAAVVTNEIERGVWISVGTIEEIEEIAETLMERGIPRKLIGCKYYKSVNNVTSKNAANFPIIISTHERIRSCDYEYLTMFKGKRRQLIWDEALISTRTHFMKLEKLFGEIYQWKSVYDLNKLRQQNTQAYAETEQYFNALVESINLAKDKTVIKLPEHPGKLELDLFRGPTLEALELPIANEAYIDKDSHMFNWCITVPDEFSNIVILDASGSHRLLEQYDSSILVFPMKIYKDYSDVTINYCKAFVGKTSLDDPSKNLPMYQELAHIVRSLDKDKKVVCFHLPEKIGVEHPPQRMNLTLNNDTDKGRVIYRSWGASKGVNCLSEVMYGIHIGMIYRDT